MRGLVGDALDNDARNLGSISDSDTNSPVNQALFIFPICTMRLKIID